MSARARVRHLRAAVIGKQIPNPPLKTPINQSDHISPDQYLQLYLPQKETLPFYLILFFLTTHLTVKLVIYF